MQNEQPNISVYPIAAFNDNYIWCLAQVNPKAASSQCVVVDPGDARPVLAELQRRNMTLSAILITHHHADHTGGIRDLKRHYPDATVYAFDKDNIPLVDQLVAEGQHVTIPALQMSFEVLFVPGHTLDHIAYYGDGMLFCGDTLFSVGCGRLFEGTPKQMHQSLQKLVDLPADTRVYCAHEYTLDNLEFAQAVEPNNPVMVEFRDWAEQQRKDALPTLPSKLATEVAINPFLRCDQPEVAAAASARSGRSLSDAEEVFAVLRDWKDNF